MQIDNQLLRRLMCHSDKTVKEWCLRESLTQEAAEALVLIEQHTQSTKADSKPSLPSPSKKQQGEEEMSAPQDVDSPKADFATSGKSGSSEKTFLSIAQQNEVDKIFADDIRSEIEPRKMRMVALMKSNLVLWGLINSQPYIKRVIDRVRYLFDTRCTVDPFEVPEETAEKRTATFLATIPERPPSTRESTSIIICFFAYL